MRPELPVIRLALVGIGKIARDQHLPVLSAHSGFQLIATADPVTAVESLPAYPNIESLLDREDVDAIAISTPPQARFEIARRALEEAKHVLLEKPPCVSVEQVKQLAALSAQNGAILYTAWHSQHAAGVSAARGWLRDRPNIDRIAVDWRENVREWHPGQKWIWKGGGMGVFDPGINALSILSTLFPQPASLTAATLWIPSNCATPIAAELSGNIGNSPQFRASFDFRQAGDPTWNIEIRSGREQLILRDGGARVALNGVDQPIKAKSEYDSMYQRFHQLILAHSSEIETRPRGS
jgi:D-galactose 1-dehydrogenase